MDFGLWIFNFFFKTILVGWTLDFGFKNIYIYMSERRVDFGLWTFKYIKHPIATGLWTLGLTFGDYSSSFLYKKTNTTIVGARACAAPIIGRRARGTIFLGAR